MKMTPSEAFVETLRKYKVDNIFGIVGSAFMDALDIFPAANIRFIPTVHEQGAAHMADGYSRAGQKHGICIGQNGPGISNFVTAIAGAYWAHSPVIAITPETGTNSMGLGGFQETDQIPMFSKITKYQGHVSLPSRMAEITDRCFYMAKAENGPVQLNIPRNNFYGEIDVNINEPRTIRYGGGNSEDIEKAAILVSKAKNPVILSGGGVVMSDGINELVSLSEYLGVPVVNSYLHNDSFPSSHKLWCGPLGYQGSKAAMKLIAKADLVLAIGTRLGPFGTLPQHGIDYWPRDANIIQVDIDHKVLGLVKPIKIGICGDAKEFSKLLLTSLKGKTVTCIKSIEKRYTDIKKEKDAWEKELTNWTEEQDEWSKSIDKKSDTMTPRRGLRELEKALPKDVMVSTDIGNICSISNSYLRFERPNSFFAAMSFGNCGYALPTIIGAKVACPDRPAVAYVGDGAWTMSFTEILTCVRENIPVTGVVFNNGQWGAEKKNQVDFYGRRFLGTNLNNPNFAEVGMSLGAEGIRVTRAEDVRSVMEKAFDNQNKGKTTVVELMVTKELGDPFRRDALSKPVRFLDRYKDFI